MIFKRNKKKKISANIFNFNNKNKLIKRRKKIINFNKIKNFNIDKKVFFYYYIWVIIIIFIAIIAVLFSPTFSIKNIEIIKKDNTTNIELAYKSIDFLNIRWKSILTLKKTNIIDKLIEDQKNIKDVGIETVLPNTIKIIIWSYRWLFTTNIEEKKDIITENWVFIPTKNEIENLANISIKSRINDNLWLIDYKKILDSTYIKSILNIKNELENNLLSIEIKKTEYYEIEREVHFYINNDTILIFDLNWDIKKQIESIVIFNKENFNLNQDWIIYIDLRIKDKIFYCTKEDEYNCKKNLESIY